MGRTQKGWWNVNEGKIIFIFATLEMKFSVFSVNADKKTSMTVTNSNYVSYCRYGKNTVGRKLSSPNIVIK